LLLGVSTVGAIIKGLEKSIWSGSGILVADEATAFMESAGMGTGSDKGIKSGAILRNCLDGNGAAKNTETAGRSRK
jgi:hypothetical protein